MISSLLVCLIFLLIAMPTHADHLAARSNEAIAIEKRNANVVRPIRDDGIDSFAVNKGREERRGERLNAKTVLSD